MDCFCKSVYHVLIRRCIYQHVAFYQKLKSDRDKAYGEKDKAKQAYDDACAEVENLKAKIDRGTGDQDKVMY